MRQIKDQGHCGSCWAFGAAEAFSDRICVTLGRNVTISENDLLSCCGETTCGGCDGGGFSGSWAYFNTTGAVSEECDPYFDQKGCQHPGCEPVWPTPACSKTCKDSESWTEAKVSCEPAACALSGLCHAHARAKVVHTQACARSDIYGPHHGAPVPLIQALRW